MLKDEFELSYELACRWWKRIDLEDQPVNIERVAQVLKEAGIEVYEVSPAGWLSCQPCPQGVHEALSGSLTLFTDDLFSEYPPETPGTVLRRLSELGISVGIQCHPSS